MTICRILAIDDDNDTLYTLKAIGEIAGYEVMPVENGHKGLELFCGNYYDLCIVDYHMPQMNGLKVVSRIRKIDSTIPILVLTVDESLELARKFLAEGASDFAIKPIRTPDLISRIKLHLKLNKYQGMYTVENILRDKLPKGLSSTTLQFIIETLKKNKEALTLNVISSITGLAYQTVHRYLDFLLQEDYVKLEIDYGKVGRPVHKYKFKRILF